MELLTFDHRIRMSNIPALQIKGRQDPTCELHKSEVVGQAAECTSYLKR